MTRDDWTGTASELLEALTPDRPPKGWPGTGRALAASLRRLVNPLAAAGIVVTFGERTMRARPIRLERVTDDANASSIPPRTDTAGTSAPDTRPRTDGESSSSSSSSSYEPIRRTNGAETHDDDHDDETATVMHRHAGSSDSTHESGRHDGNDDDDGLFASVLGRDAPTVQGHDPDLYRAHALAIRLVDGKAVCDTCAGATA